jgi:hypothetical protein
LTPAAAHEETAAADRRATRRRHTHLFNINLVSQKSE